MLDHRQPRLVHEAEEVEFLRASSIDRKPYRLIAIAFNERFGRALSGKQIQHQFRIWGLQMSLNVERTTKGSFRDSGGEWAKGTPPPLHAWQKGYKPAHTAALGTEKRTPQGWLRKIGENKKGGSRKTGWQYVHILNWIEANGPIPANMSLMCLGDRMDPSVENHILVPKGAVPRIHRRFLAGLALAPQSIKLAIVAAGVLEHEIAERAKHSPASLPTRAQAKEIGSLYYFSGKQCPHGHQAARFTQSSQCTVCAAKYRIGRRAELRKQKTLTLPLPNSERPVGQTVV
jgi:hypothetical protein